MGYVEGRAGMIPTLPLSVIMQRAICGPEALLDRGQSDGRRL
jgi:hypothetical protein